jgi:hypothetical protein
VWARFGGHLGCSYDECVGWSAWVASAKAEVGGSGVLGGRAWEVSA